MRVRLEFFGKLGDMAGALNGEIDLPPHVADTAALRTWLDESQGFQGALVHPSIKLAVDDEVLNRPAPLKEGDSVAFLPPVGGG